jgi:DNA topoisomerase-1
MCWRRGTAPSVSRLRRSDPSGPGLRRCRRGRGFAYLDADGRRVDDPETLARVEALTIPPAWTDVWICAWPNGHIQAVGFDARGRRQYRYHDAWRVRRDAEKFDRILTFAQCLPGMRARCATLLELEGLPKERVLACAFRLLDVGFFRIGGEEYAQENGSYGLATMEKRHTRIVGDKVIFDYPAKSGQHRSQSVVDPAVRDVLAALKRRRGGGPELLAFREHGRWVDLRSGDINQFLRDLSGLDISAKDFRTWNATVLAAVALAVSWAASESPTARTRAVRRAVCEVASYLGNTPTVCRTSYIDPRVVDLYLDGTTIRRSLDNLGTEQPYGLATQGAIERAVLGLLGRNERRRRAA